ncbi:MAG: TlpA family protein disulfide reductase [Phycisphaerae bacterium]|nr:TlpA family protein disulfide reductase [Phycisphaerae bacterium]
MAPLVAAATSDAASNATSTIASTSAATSNPATSPESANAPTVNVPTVPGCDGEIRDVIARALRQYAGLRTYEDEATFSVEVDVEGHDLGALPEPETMKLVFARPNRLLLQAPLFHVLSDGKQFREAIDVWMLYRQTPTPAPLSIENFTVNKFPALQPATHPILHLLIPSGQPSLDFVGTIERFDAIRKESLDGRPGKRIVGVEMGRQPHEKMQRVLELWFDDQTGLIGEIAYDYTKAVKASTAQQGIKVKKYVQRVRFQPLRVNEPIADDRFALPEETGFVKVNSLSMPSPREWHTRIIGRPAFEFIGTDWEGKKLTLSELKGRVILLDFWSVRCPPCIASMPTLQHVAEKFANEPFTLIGINMDGPLAAEQVKAITQAQKAQFRQVLQTKPDMGQRYFIESIPCAVLIDAKGIIQYVHVGMADERALIEQISKLLKGEKLYADK